MKTAYMIAVLLLSAAALAQESRFYEFTMLKHVDSLSYSTVILRAGEVPFSVGQGGYRAELEAFNGTVLHTTYFDFVQELLGEDFDFETGQITSKVMTINASNATLAIPYAASGSQISVYSGDTRVLEIPVAHFADVCGDGVCQPHESYESCPRDCRSGGKDDFCDAAADGVCDADCTAAQDADCSDAAPADSGEGAMQRLAFAIAVIGAAVILSVYYLRKKNSKTVDKIVEKLGK